MKTIIYGKFKHHIIHAPLVCGVLFFFFKEKKNYLLYCVFKLTFAVLKILWVLGKKGALARWDLNQQQKKKRSVSVVIPQKCFHAFKINFFSFCIFWLIWSFPLSMPRCWGSPGTFLLPFPWLSSLPPCLQVQTCCLSWSHSVTETSGEHFPWPPCCHFQRFIVFILPHPHTLCYHLYFILLLVFSVRSLSACCVA